MCDILSIFRATGNAACLITCNQFLNAFTQTFMFRPMLLLEQYLVAWQLEHFLNLTSTSANILPKQH